MESNSREETVTKVCVGLCLAQKGGDQVSSCRFLELSSVKDEQREQLGDASVARNSSPRSHTRDRDMPYKPSDTGTRGCHAS